ncbi:MAG: EutN/CcmL family microcompartment protein [Spirochaetota bacterium]
MILGRVVGTVVSTRKNDSIQGAKYLLVERCDQRTRPVKDYIVALDPLDAGPDEIVILSQGSSARQMEVSDKKPIDAVIVGIVDLIDELGKVVYRK